MNKILNKVIESRKGHYIHAIEVSNVYDIECIIDSLINEFTEDEGYTIEDIKEFFNTISIYYLEDEELDEETNNINEDEIYAFDIDNYITETYE